MPPPESAYLAGDVAQDELHEARGRRGVFRGQEQVVMVTQKAMCMKANCISLHSPLDDAVDEGIDPR